MSQAPIEFGNWLASGSEELGGATSQAMNVVTDPRTGSVLRRPGISSYDVAPATSVDGDGIDGLHATLDGNLYATGRSPGVGARKLYRINNGSAASYVTNLSGSGRAIFAETEALLVLTSGKYLYKVEKDNTDLSRLGGDPPETDHVVANANRLSANDIKVDTTKVRFSAIASGDVTFAGLESWDPADLSTGSRPGFYSAEARPDPVVAIAETTNDIFVFGTNNVELFSPDTQLVYSRTSVREYGLVARYSVVKTDEAFAWLDHRRRFVLSDGRNFDNSMGEPIQKVIDAMGRVDDCFGYRVRIDQIDCMVWTFPTEGQTFCFQKGLGWSQWQGWDEVSNNWAPHVVLSHHHRDDTDVSVVGTTSGVVAKYDMSVNDDLGVIIPANTTTGFQSRGTEKRKKCNAVYVTLSRGENAVATEEPQAFLSYSDRPGNWSSKIPLHLGNADDTDPVIPLYSLGWYRRRQWRFEFSGTERLSLVAVKEDYTVLES